MTEWEWERCAPAELPRILNILSGGKTLGRKTSDRKVWLFACACCRGIWPLFTDLRSRTAVEVAERFAEGLVTADELEAAREEAEAAVRKSDQPLAISVMAERVARSERSGNPWAAASSAFSGLLDPGWRAERIRFTRGLGDRRRREIFDVAAVLGEVIGPLAFRPLAIDPAAMSWQGGTLPQVAQAIYDERDFSSMPVLADALEDAGVVDEDILSHCREPRRHVRGCWVVDLILGKS